MTSIAAFPAGATVVGQKTVGTNAGGDELVETTVEMRVSKSAAFGPAVQIVGSERFAGMAYRAQAEDDSIRVTGGEKSVVDSLRLRDGQVRQEEQAHAMAAGDMAGAIQYTYAKGPDGKSYVTGGFVPIRPSASYTQAGAENIAARLNATANAATNPSRADMAVASRGYSIATNIQDSVGPFVDKSA